MATAKHHPDMADRAYGLMTAAWEAGKLAAERGDVAAAKRAGAQIRALAETVEKYGNREQRLDARSLRDRAHWPERDAEKAAAAKQ